jgi:hypothetical protein
MSDDLSKWGAEAEGIAMTYDELSKHWAEQIIKSAQQAAQRTIAVLTEDKPDDCDYDDCINYEENELCYRWSSGECTGPRMPK